jgi:hypothetical protein
MLTKYEFWLMSVHDKLSIPHSAKQTLQLACDSSSNSQPQFRDSPRLDDSQPKLHRTRRVKGSLHGSCFIFMK